MANDICKAYLKAFRKVVRAKDNEKIDKRYKPYLAPNNKYYDAHCGYCAEVEYLSEIYNKPKVSYEELGGIKHAWVKCSDGISRCLGRFGDDEEEMIEKGEASVRAAKEVKIAENYLEAKYPNLPKYIEHLPSPDIEFDGEEGEYIFVLKSRKRRGKFVILEAIKLG